MAFKHISMIIGQQAFDEVSTTKQHEIGQCARGVDDAGVRGEAEFIYLPGVASTAAGDVVVFDQFAGTTTRTVAASRGPVAVAMAATVANTYGWYQICGAATVKAGTVADNGAVYLTSTAGQIDDQVVLGQLVSGARLSSANGVPAAGFAVAQLAHPSADGAA